MQKLEITEVQIDKFNDTYKQLVKFNDGLNVVTGDNEAGKSTLMQFITNIFIRKSNADGYIKCLCNDEEFVLDAKKSKQKNNIPCLEKMTSKNFEHGFFIDLEDLMQIKKNSSELLDTIKDSSGAEINTKEDEFSKLIKNSFTTRNTATTTLKKEFAKLDELNNKIKELQNNEAEYNSKLEEIKELKKEINKLDENINYINLSLKTKEFQANVDELKINKTLLKNKENFQKLKENFYQLKTEYNTIMANSSLIDAGKERYQIEQRRLNEIEYFEENNIDNFDVTKGSQVAELQTELLTTTTELKTLEEKILDKQTQIKKIENEIKDYQNSLNSLEIKNIEDYTDDKNYLKKYLEKYNQALEKQTLSANTKNQQTPFVTIILSILFLGLFILAFSTGTAKYGLFIISIIGLVLCSKEFFNTNNKNTINPDIEHYKSELVQILNKYTDSYTDTSVSASIMIDKMEKSISEYNRLTDLISKHQNDLNTENIALSDLSVKENETKKTLENIKNKEKEFLTSNNLRDIKNYNEISNIIRTLREINQKISEKEDYSNTFNKNIEEFITCFNQFIKENNLTTIMPVYKEDFENIETTIKNISSILDKTLQNNALLEENTKRLNSLQPELKNFQIEDNSTLVISEEMLENLSEQLKEKQKELAIYSNRINELKEVESIVDKKNQKNAEINRLKKLLNNLFIKEILIKLIQNSKEEFNKVQPNLISAKNYLSEITEEKYTEINFDRNTIFGNKIGEKEWENLSRGTKEQLYLALRLGYAQNYSLDNNGEENGRPNLPLIIDDAFVNFDKTRTISALKCLNTFSKTNQVIYFTCHKQIINLLKENDIKCNHIEL